MDNIAINLNFIKDKEHWSNQEQLPFVMALSGLMILTGVYRLFEKEDAEEVFKRAQLLLPERYIIDNFFSNESLFKFGFNDLQYEFTTEHLKGLIGLETLDASENRLSFLDWTTKVKGCIDMYHLLLGFGVFEGIRLTEFSSHVTPIEQGIDIDLSKKSDFELTLNPQLLAHANLLGETISKDLGLPAFNRIKEEFPNKLKVLALRNAPFEEPEFDFEKLPLEKQQELWKVLWPDMEHFKDPSQRKQHGKLMYLAWLWVNGFVMKDSSGFYYVDPRMTKFCLSDYEDEDGATNLFTTYEDYSLEDLTQLLVDPAIQRISERPWDKIDVYAKVEKT